MARKQPAVGQGRPGQVKGAAKEKKSGGGLTKDASGSFLKQRQGKKVRDLLGSEAGVGATASGPLLRTTAGGVADTLRSLQAEAERRNGDFANALGDITERLEAEEDVAIGVNPGREAENTRKKFYVELRKVLASADVIIEVLDARDPSSCRCVEVEKAITSAGKRLIILLNKVDLVPKHATEAWVKHLKRSFPVLAFKAAHGGAKRPTHAMTSLANAPEGLLQSTHAVVGADELMQLLKNYARMGDGGKTKGQLTVGIVGYPNTGKSSVINSMKRHCAVETGGRAGVTKVLQEVQLDSKITLIDSPGIVFEGASDDPSVILRNVVRVESVGDPVGVVDAMIRKAPREALLKFYGLQSDFATVADLLIHVAQARGRLRRGSGLDLPSAARSVISDWTTGKFRYYALPPADSAAEAQAVAETAEILPSLSEAFDIDALFSGEGDKPTVLGMPQEDDGSADVAMGDGALEVNMEA
mmetsp:Transcript_83032/g.240229  ORF Transcript_83032/g.240229 Transcript_83032/m.240229 type:complete len:473 (+) Transcript_83032:82-1500(+)|eukprot:CAMPEP_0176025930 /NCGR_PEP_ID=MMETSP0120_2-20121206/12694_1 /TAXON_ID=160619 /ORGANISM="Kryptoperidinium foliaceum, Strain CCMP 1326" /LENGTH=472 /DNA_ID=CAMNT_0017359121 /DNA_START=79 /DNA_END=1497 /DNA_ORIENTATION=+